MPTTPDSPMTDVELSLLRNAKVEHCVIVRIYDWNRVYATIADLQRRLRETEAVVARLPHTAAAAREPFTTKPETIAHVIGNPPVDPALGSGTFLADAAKAGEGKP